MSERFQGVNSINRVGYRILYDAKGCSIAGRDEYKTEINVSGQYDVQVYFGPKPQHGIRIVSDCSKYYIPGSEARFGKIECVAQTDGSGGCGPFFFEAVVIAQANELTTAEDVTHDALIKQAESRREELKGVICLVAGIVGLRFQRQFVLEPYNENALAWKTDTPAQGIGSPVLETLEHIRINENGIKHLEALKQPFASLSVDMLAKYSLVFHWLLRAWHERDHLHTFLALFIPLEALLTIVTESKMSAEEECWAKAIRKIIKEHGGTEVTALLAFLNRLVTRTGPTLDDRFVDVAESAKLPGWQADIDAFRKFKRMRNMLVHGSDTNVQQILTVEEDEVRTLQDLVERYVNYCLFRDNNVYRSRWRPVIKETNTAP